ncbi:MAG: hypothetical protein D6831_03805 [Aquificota bacterium]|nr:MAG: hypothetical protein D6831_03805 [Aquificota bacterium]
MCRFQVPAQGKEACKGLQGHTESEHKREEVAACCGKAVQRPGHLRARVHARHKGWAQRAQAEED